MAPCGEGWSIPSPQGASGLPGGRDRSKPAWGLAGFETKTVPKQATRNRGVAKIMNQADFDMRFLAGGDVWVHGLGPFCVPEN